MDFNPVARTDILEIDSLEELSILQRENEYEIIVDFVNMSIEIYSDYRE